MFKSFKLKFKPSLQLRILLLTVLIVTVVLGISDSISTLHSVKALEDEIGEQTTMASHRLAGDIRRLAPEDIGDRFHRSYDKVLELVPNIIRADVYVMLGGKLQMATSTSLPAERTPEEYELSALQSGQSDTYMVEEENGPRRIVAVEPFRFPGGQTGIVTVISSMKSVNDLMAVQSRIRLVTLGSTILLLVVAITFLFRTTVYRSVLHLVRTMHLFQEGDVTVRAQENLPGEFKELASHLNHMLDRIGKFHEEMRDQIQSATNALAFRNQELESLNLLLYETQKRLLQAERLALIGQLTATFAHEIGSPLSAVSTHLQMLQESGPLPPAVRERVGLVEAQINRICGIVEHLLADSRRAASLVRVDVADVLRTVSQLLGPTLQSRQIRLTLAGDPGPLWILGNPDQLQQLCLNLLNNSLDAIADGGAIEISLALLPGRLPEEAARAQMQIRDSGAGIPQDKLANIFEPFFTTKDFGKGTGLGLAVSREIVRQHGGEISVASPPGSGAVFTLTFPIITTSEPAPADAACEEAKA
jgi:two-component system, NtrC family, sensor kinase